MNKRRINLMPKEVRPKLQISREMAVLGFLIVAFLYVIVSAIGLQASFSRQQARAIQLVEKNRRIASELSRLDLVERAESQSAEQLSSMKDIITRRMPWSDLFKELSLLAPKNVWLSEMTTKIENASTSIVLKGEAASQKSVADFFLSLEQSFYFGTVQIRYSEKEPGITPDLFKFEFVAPLLKHDEGAT